MYKLIAGRTWAAAVLSLAVASAQTYPQTSDNQPTTKSTPSTTKSTPSTRSSQTDTSRHRTARTTTSSSGSANAAQCLTVTGCVTQGSSAPQSASASRSTTDASGWILSNATVSESTSTAVGTGGTNAAPVSGIASNAYQLTGITNPKEYSSKRVEITGVLDNTRASGSDPAVTAQRTRATVRCRCCG
jgi:hypothetical protein